MTLGWLIDLGHQWPEWALVEWLCPSVWSVFCSGKAGLSAWPPWGSSMDWTDATFLRQVTSCVSLKYHVTSWHASLPLILILGPLTLQLSKKHSCFILVSDFGLLGSWDKTYLFTSSWSVLFHDKTWNRNFFEYEKLEKNSLCQKKTKLSQNKINK